MTANVCVPTVCSTHTVPYKLQNSSMGIARKVVCKLNDCMHPGQELGLGGLCWHNFGNNRYQEALSIMRE